MIQTHDLCDSGANALPLSFKARADQAHDVHSSCEIIFIYTLSELNSLDILIMD